jgi:hypothetical protein
VHVKQRAFDPEPTSAESVPRTEPTPHGRTSIALVLASWAMPLAYAISIFVHFDDDPSMALVHRVVALLAIGLLLGSSGLAVRAIDLARKNPRLRRRLAIATLVLAVFTPVVWFAEVVLAMEVLIVRERVDASAVEAGAAPPAPHE